MQLMKKISDRVYIGLSLVVITGLMSLAFIFIVGGGQIWYAVYNDGDLYATDTSSSVVLYEVYPSRVKETLQGKSLTVPVGSVIGTSTSDTFQAFLSIETAEEKPAYYCYPLEPSYQDTVWFGVERDAYAFSDILKEELRVPRDVFAGSDDSPDVYEILTYCRFRK